MRRTGLVTALGAGIALGASLGGTATLGQAPTASSAHSSPAPTPPAPVAKPVGYFQDPVGYTTGGGWVVWSNGLVKAMGGPATYGDLPSRGIHVNDIVSMLPTYNGRGYYLVGADGGVFAFGDAKFYGALTMMHSGAALLTGPIIGMAYCNAAGDPSKAPTGYVIATVDGNYWPFGNCGPLP